MNCHQSPPSSPHDFCVEPKMGPIDWEWSEQHTGRDHFASLTNPQSGYWHPLRKSRCRRTLALSARAAYSAHFAATGVVDLKWKTDSTSCHFKKLPFGLKSFAKLERAPQSAKRLATVSILYLSAIKLSDADTWVILWWLKLLHASQSFWVQMATYGHKVMRQLFSELHWRIKIMKFSVGTVDQSHVTTQ